MHLFLLFSLLSLSHLVHGWGIVGHEVVGTIAEVLLFPSALRAIHDARLLPPPSPTNPRAGHLAAVAGWPDRVRGTPYGWSTRLHYANAVGDWPPRNCSLDGGWKDDRNVLTAISNYTDRLISGEGEPRNVSLAFVIHFIADIHQPLHLTGRNRGGNGDQVFFEHRHTSMHSVWDSGIISKHIREQHNYTRPLPNRAIESALTGAIYDPYIRLILWEGLRQWWNQDLAGWLNCSSSPDVEYPLDMHSTSQTTFRSPTPQLSLPKTLCPQSWAEQIHPLDCGTVYPDDFDDETPSPPLASSSAAGASLLSRLAARSLPSTMGWWMNLMAKPLPPAAEAALQEALHTVTQVPDLSVPKYLDPLKRDHTVEKLLAMAGVRLAAVLNAVFAEEETAMSQGLPINMAWVEEGDEA